jgi:hypothetical protein
MAAVSATPGDAAMAALAQRWRAELRAGPGWIAMFG